MKREEETVRGLEGWTVDEEVRQEDWQEKMWKDWTGDEVMMQKDWPGDEATLRKNWAGAGEEVQWTGQEDC